MTKPFQGQVLGGIARSLFSTLKAAGHILNNIGTQRNST